jgi:voltage-gated potassium channel
MPTASSRSWQSRLHETIYESNTTAGKIFDIALLVLILFSIVVVMLDSVEAYYNKYGHLFYVSEWIFTILVTLEHPSTHMYPPAAAICF